MGGNEPWVSGLGQLGHDGAEGLVPFGLVAGVLGRLEAAELKEAGDRGPLGAGAFGQAELEGVAVVRSGRFYSDSTRLLIEEHLRMLAVLEIFLHQDRTDGEKTALADADFLFVARAVTIGCIGNKTHDSLFDKRDTRNDKR